MHTGGDIRRAFGRIAKEPKEACLQRPESKPESKCGPAGHYANKASASCSGCAPQHHYRTHPTSPLGWAHLHKEKGDLERRHNAADPREEESSRGALLLLQRAPQRLHAFQHACVERSAYSVQRSRAFAGALDRIPSRTGMLTDYLSIRVVFRDAGSCRFTSFFLHYRLTTVNCENVGSDQLVRVSSVRAYRHTELSHH